MGVILSAETNLIGYHSPPQSDFVPPYHATDISNVRETPKPDSNMLVGSWDDQRDMDWDRIEGNWKQFKGKIKEQWGDLTDDDLDAIAGRRDQLEGKIQERYGLAKDQVRRDIDDWYAPQKW